jgi:hypothetical protein
VLKMVKWLKGRQASQNSLAKQTWLRAFLLKLNERSADAEVEKANNRSGVKGGPVSTNRNSRANQDTSSTR